MFGNMNLKKDPVSTFLVTKPKTQQFNPGLQDDPAPPLGVAIDLLGHLEAWS